MSNKNKKNNFNKEVAPVVEDSALAVVSEVPAVAAPVEEVIPTTVADEPMAIENSVLIDTSRAGSQPMDVESELLRQSTQQEKVRAKQILNMFSDYVENGGIDTASYVVPEKYQGGNKPVKPEPLFGQFYKVTNLAKNGQTFLPGDPRKCPCNKIHLNLKQVESLAMDGYTMQLLDMPVVTAGGFSRITSKNVHAYILRVKMLIDNGIIKDN